MFFLLLQRADEFQLWSRDTITTTTSSDPGTGDIQYVM
jgi:hypothetical protein